MKKDKVMASYDVGHEISLLCGHILRLAGKSESDVGGGGVTVTFKQLFGQSEVLIIALKNVGICC